MQPFRHGTTGVCFPSITGDTAQLGFAEGSVPTLAAYLERVHPDDSERVRADFVALARGQRKQRVAAYRLLSRSGDETWVEGDAHAILDFDDTVHRIVGFFRPVHVDRGSAAGMPP